MTAMQEKEVEPLICEPGGRGLLFPLLASEQHWPGALRAILYAAALFYLFLGVSIVADKFVSAIEAITSKKRRVLQRSSGRFQTVEVWNKTIGNLTLMALGSSAPEIILSCVEIITNNFHAGELGPSCIVGSAAFNLFIIIGVCIVSIPSPETRRIKEVGVYVVTLAFSLFAYVWLVFIVQVSSPDVVDIWEAGITLLLMPVLVVISYLADIGWFTGGKKPKLKESSDDRDSEALFFDGELGNVRPFSSVQTQLADVRMDPDGLEPVPLRMERLRRVLSPRAPTDTFESAASFAAGSDPAAPRFAAADPGDVTDWQGRLIRCPHGVLTFAEDSLEMAAGLQEKTFRVPVFRKNGAEGEVSCRYRMEGRTAVPNYDFVESEGELTFAHGETMGEVEVELKPKQIGEVSDQFQIILEDAEGGAIFNPNDDGGDERCVLTITILNENEAFARHSSAVRASRFVDQVVNMDQMRLGTANWYEDIMEAIFEVGDSEEGEKPSTADMLFHIISLPWKLLFAISVPPPAFAGGWVCFVASLVAIGAMTCIVIDFAELFGCVTGIPDSVTALTFVALGTSMPDLFASMAAAAQDKYADASIVNVTGSNSVNVFLGIGLPWTLAAVYWRVVGATGEWTARYGEKFGGDYPNGAFIVIGGDLGFGVIVFTVGACVALALLQLRRTKFGGELGGPIEPKMLSGALLAMIWLFYVSLSIWKVANKDIGLGDQLFAIFVGICVLENVMLAVGLGLYAKKSVSARREAADASSRQLRSPNATKPALMGRPDYGSAFQQAPCPFPDALSFTTAALVCLAAKRFKHGAELSRQKGGRRVSIQRSPSFYSVDGDSAHDEHTQPGGPIGAVRQAGEHVVGWVRGSATDWAALAVAGIAAGQLADPSGSGLLGV